MKKLIIALLLLLISIPSWGAQTNYRHLDPETVAYNTLVNGVNPNWQTLNEAIKQIKYGSGITLTSVALNRSDVALTAFITNPVFTYAGPPALPSSDLREGLDMCIINTSKRLHRLE